MERESTAQTLAAGMGRTETDARTHPHVHINTHPRDPHRLTRTPAGIVLRTVTHAHTAVSIDYVPVLK